MEVFDILFNNENIIFNDYKEFFLKNPINMKENLNQELIYKLNKLPNCEAFYNSKTYNCDIIGIVDINNVRYYDFDDDFWTMTNKGIDVSTSKTIFD